MARVFLKSGRERSVVRRHPWIFSGAIERLDGSPEPGETVEVLAADGTFVARAAYSPASQIQARVWTFDEGEAVDADFLRRRLARSVESRRRLGFLALLDVHERRFLAGQADLDVAGRKLVGHLERHIREEVEQPQACRPLERLA